MMLTNGNILHSSLIPVGTAPYASVQNPSKTVIVSADPQTGAF